MLDIVFKVMDVIGDGDIFYIWNKYTMKQIKMKTKNIEIESKNKQSKYCTQCTQ